MFNTVKNYKNSEQFKTDALNFAFSQQSKPVNFDLLHQIFIDSNGKRYFKYNQDSDTPIVRKGKIDESMAMALSKFSEGEMDVFITKGDELCSTALNSLTQEGRIDNVAKLKAFFEEMKSRQTIPLHPDMMFEVVAYMYIREDEKHDEVDEDIQAQKIIQFKKDSKGGLRDFFYMAALKEYIPYLNISDEDFQKLVDDCRLLLQASNQIPHLLTSSGLSKKEDSSQQASGAMQTGKPQNIKGSLKSPSRTIST